MGQNVYSAVAEKAALVEEHCLHTTWGGSELLFEKLLSFPQELLQSELDHLDSAEDNLTHYSKLLLSGESHLPLAHVPPCILFQNFWHRGF